MTQNQTSSTTHQELPKPILLKKLKRLSSKQSHPSGMATDDEGGPLTIQPMVLYQVAGAVEVEVAG